MNQSTSIDETRQGNPLDSDLLHAALTYAARGWRVMPLHSVQEGHCTCGRADCDSPGKHPRTAHGLKDATTDENTIRAWYARATAANNIAIVTGAASGLVIVDADGPEGLDSLTTLLGCDPRWLETPRVKTGKGWHVYFRHPGGAVRNFVKKLPGVDLRADSGYVVAPPSRHASGAAYQWSEGFSPDDVPLADMPAELRALCESQPSPRASVGETPTGDPIPDGARDNTLTSLGGTMRRRGMTYEAILAALYEENQRRCVPPLPDMDVMRIAKSVARYEPAESAAVEPEPSEPVLPGWTPPPPLTPIRGPAFLKEFVEIMQPVVPGLPLDWSVFAFLTGASALLTHIRMANLRPNLYFMGIGAAGTGKSLVLSRVKRIVRRIAKTTDVPLQLVTSSSVQGLLLAATQGAVFAVYDEYAGTLKAIKNQEHLVNLKETLNFLYDGESLSHRLRKKTDSFEVEQVAVVLAATNQPGFRANVDQDDMVNGYLSRFLIVAADPKRQLMESDPDDDALDALADRLAEHLKTSRDVSWACFGTSWPWTETREAAAEPIARVEVPQIMVCGDGREVSTDRVLRFPQAVETQIDLDDYDLGYWYFAMLREASMRTGGEATINLETLTDEPSPDATAGRVLVQAMKIAVILEMLEAQPRVRAFAEPDRLPSGATVGDRYLAVRDRNIEQAIALAQRSQRFAERTYRWLTSNEDQRLADQIERILLAHPKGIIRSELYKATHTKGVVWFNRVLEMLDRSGRAIKSHRQSGRRGGRPAECWFHVVHARTREVA